VIVAADGDRGFSLQKMAEVVALGYSSAVADRRYS
jgi:hypothetical protein